MTIETLTADEIALCEALSLERQILAARTDLANARQMADVARASNSFDALWAGSVSASVMHRYRVGAVRTVQA